MPGLTRMRADENAAGGLDVALRLKLAGPAGPFELDVALRIAAGSFVAITGPSGAGKTSLLRMIAGLAKPESGHVRIDGITWSDSSADLDLPTHCRSIGFVFQDYALFPNMTVWRNVEYAMGAAARRDEIGRLLQLVGLDGLAKAYPDRLSGGQKQRLALIRALARRPAVLMLDEPLSALDPEMRRRLQEELRQLHLDFGTTTLMVSHDVSEILRVADRVIRLDEGRVVGDGSPARIFGHADTAGGIHMLAEHVAGPDSEGRATVRIDGKPHLIRYRNHPEQFEAGDLVMLHVDGVTVQRV